MIDYHGGTVARRGLRSLIGKGSRHAGDRASRGMVRAKARSQAKVSCRFWLAIGPSLKP